ncbi:hypothetical protein EAG_12799 [Camponotus floridanus]|uniref:Uncharacterized protein n=1 Tax=Camponotus floridanus TaxID=104421 RepID=E2ASX9_CAMFO|nr:hypothetical protein EAG_12799 [Camponotus floridanus]
MGEGSKIGDAGVRRGSPEKSFEGRYMNRARAQGELAREDGGKEEEEETIDEDLGLASGLEKEKVIIVENQVVCHTLGNSLEEEFPETDLLLEKPWTNRYELLLDPLGIEDGEILAELIVVEEGGCCWALLV